MSAGYVWVIFRCILTSVINAPAGIPETGIVNADKVPILSGTLKFKGPDVNEAVDGPETVFVIVSF
jgi:hypothetical protein